MADQSRKYIKTKFDGVYYRLSTKKDARTGEQDRVYCFWWSDAEGKGHWKTIGRHSKGVRPQFARQARNEFLAQLDAGNNPALREQYTIGQAVDAYVSWARAEGKHVDKPLQQYDKHLRQKLHTMPVSAVTAGLLSKIKEDLATTRADLSIPIRQRKSYVAPPARTLSPQTIVHLFSFLRRCVNRSIATGMWSGANPFASRKNGAWQMPKVDNGRLRFFTPQEATALLASLREKSPQLHDMALLSLKTGIRATEIFKLRGQDVNAQAGVLHITAKGGRMESIHAPDDIISMLLGYGRTGGEYIFQKRGDAGGPIDSTSGTFRRTVQELGLDTSDGDTRFAVTFHTLRHTFGSWLAQSGEVSLIELKTLMRHRTLTMTQRYAHLIPGQERKRLSIIDSTLNSAHG
jgi:integrase